VAVVVPEARGKFGNKEEGGTSAVGSRYQNTGEETEDREDAVRTLVTWRLVD
jgi:hypothetical protein